MPVSWQLLCATGYSASHARTTPKLLQAQQSSEEALEIKRSADPQVDFCDYLTPLSAPTGLFIYRQREDLPAEPVPLSLSRLFFYRGQSLQDPMSLSAFGLTLPQTLKEYEIKLLKRKTKNGIQASVKLRKDCEAEWLPRCDACAARLKTNRPSRFFAFYMRGLINQNIPNIYYLDIFLFHYVINPSPIRADSPLKSYKL
ncbi:hypothetical protein A6J33_009180 [Pantoea sp. FDAARGOS_194]|nr:hypothetical protein A6J33_009180 [Pantoea sp. FDAARGOS_194]